MKTERELFEERFPVPAHWIDFDEFNKLKETENIISHEQTLGIKTKAA